MREQGRKKKTKKTHTIYFHYNVNMSSPKETSNIKAREYKRRISSEIFVMDNEATMRKGSTLIVLIVVRG